MIAGLPFTSTATAGGTTTLTNLSTNTQFFTGTQPQTVLLPDVTVGMQLNMPVEIMNLSTGSLTIQTSTAIQVFVVPPSTGMFFVPVSLSSNASSSWQMKCIATPGQYIASVTNDSASSGCLEKVIGPIFRLRSNSLSLTSGTATNIATTTSQTFGPGSYMGYANLGFSPGALTTVTEFDIAVSATSATLPAADTMCNSNSNGEMWLKIGFNGLTLGATDYCQNIGPIPFSVASGSTKTLFLVGRSVFGLSTMSCFGSFYAIQNR